MLRLQQKKNLKIIILRWNSNGEMKFLQRYNSGLLYHSYGDFGVGLGVWMSSHELQLRQEILAIHTEWENRIAKFRW